VNGSYIPFLAPDEPRPYPAPFHPSPHTPHSPFHLPVFPSRTHSLQIPLPPLDTKLSALRQTLSDHTHLAPNAFKLIYAGAIMKDDDAPCESPLSIARHFWFRIRSTLDSVMFPHTSVPCSV
jgi:hypothetical protein